MRRCDSNTAVTQLDLYAKPSIALTVSATSYSLLHLAVIIFNAAKTFL